MRVFADVRNLVEADVTDIGVFAVSAQLGGTPLSPLVAMRWLDDMTFPSLAVFAALCIVFLLGHEPNQSSGATVTVLGSERLVRYTFTLVVTAGYGAGDFIGHYEFHRRLCDLGCTFHRYCGRFDRALSRDISPHRHACIACPASSFQPPSAGAVLTTMACLPSSVRGVFRSPSRALAFLR